MLETWGWSDALQRDFSAHAADGLIAGRVILQQRGLYGLVTEFGEVRAEISGRLARDAVVGGYPAAGDWVALADGGPGELAIIHHVLSRRTAFTRKAAGPGGGIQVVAANVDLAFLVAALNGDLNPRRLERYLASAWQSGATPVVVLTKADLCPDVAAAVAEVETMAVGAPVLAISSRTGEGLDAVRAYLAPGRTAVMVGSSGVGKSTLLNALMGSERMATGAVREADGRGRHTTSHRELIALPGGGLLLDTPGMRELGLWDSDEGVAAVFEDIESLAASCNFGDCGHTNEPGCAVRAALERGALDDGRWQNYRKLQRELAFADAKEDPALRAARRRQWVAITKAQRSGKKARGKD
ncbi:MAG: ribosome small subunit-dependent GTPase A [Pseudomonadota bacterium]|nr:ribosome small subunit-dependent GTPase A [Pseudomonadota bacterium]